MWSGIKGKDQRTLTLSTHLQNSREVHITYIDPESNTRFLNKQNKNQNDTWFIKYFRQSVFAMALLVKSFEHLILPIQRES